MEKEIKQENPMETTDPYYKLFPWKEKDDEMQERWYDHLSRCWDIIDENPMCGDD